jgi:hypothetical protein
VAALGGDVDAVDRHLQRLQVADVAAIAAGGGAALEACGLLSCVARDGRYELLRGSGGHDVALLRRRVADGCRRWNTAFRDLTHQFLFRPFTARLGPRWGVLAGFLFSGVVHDIVISVPAHGGYGGPTLFFGIQGAALMVERSTFGRAVGLGRGARGRIFALLVLIAPVGLLFHRPFVVGIMTPFMRPLGAIR